MDLRGGQWCLCLMTMAVEHYSVSYWLLLWCPLSLFGQKQECILGKTAAYLKIHTHLALSNEQLLVKPEITCYVAVCLPWCLICILSVPREEEKVPAEVAFEHHTLMCLHNFIQCHWILSNEPIKAHFVGLLVSHMFTASCWHICIYMYYIS